MIGSIDSFFGDVVTLWSEHVELGVLESELGVLDLCTSLLGRCLLVGSLAEHLSFELQFALELGRLWVESVVEGHSLAESAVLPQTK